MFAVTVILIAMLGICIALARRAMENPNPYNDEGYLKANLSAHAAIGGLWDAGASEDDIEQIVKDALEEAQS